MRRRIDGGDDEADAEHRSRRRTVGADLLVKARQGADQGLGGASDQGNAHQQHPDREDDPFHARDSIRPVQA